MITFDISVNYNTKHEPEVSPKEIMKAHAELTESYIDYAVTSVHKSGLASQFRRLYGSIQKKLAEAIKNEAYSVEFTQGEFDFIKSAFESEECKFTPKLAQYVVSLEDAILGVSNK